MSTSRTIITLSSSSKTAHTIIKAFEAGKLKHLDVVGVRLIKPPE